MTDVQTKDFDKFQYFDSYLQNEFKNVCHYGFIQVELVNVDIPLPTSSQSPVQP